MLYDDMRENVQTALDMLARGIRWMTLVAALGVLGGVVWRFPLFAVSACAGVPIAWAFARVGAEHEREMARRLEVMDRERLSFLAPDRNTKRGAK